MKRIKNKLQQKIKAIKTVFIRMLCVSLKKGSTTTENNLCENEKIGKFEKIINWIKKIFMSENETTDDMDKIRFENDMLFNKNTTLISTGALVLSAGFIEKIIPISTAIYSPILYVSWILFISSLIINLISFLVGSNFGHNLSKLDNEGKLTIEQFNEKVNKFNRLINRFNWWVFSILVTGIITTCIFLFINFNNKPMENKTNSEKPNIQKTDIQFLNEGIKYSLKKQNSPKVITIEKPENTTATVTQTTDTITIKIEDKTK